MEGTHGRTRACKEKIKNSLEEKRNPGEDTTEGETGQGPGCPVPDKVTPEHHHLPRLFQVPSVHRPIS